MSALPSFEDVRSEMYQLLGDIEDVARSDCAPGTGPTREQADALAEALRHIAAAKTSLNAAAKRD